MKTIKNILYHTFVIGLFAYVSFLGYALFIITKDTDGIDEKSNITAISTKEDDGSDSHISLLEYMNQHGSRLAPSYEEVNCVEFMDKLLNEYINIPSHVSKNIYINVDINSVPKYLEIKDSTIISGVCGTLVENGYANWVKPTHLKKGDIIQYWSTNGFTNGHCGVYFGEDDLGYILLSSHPDSKGYGKMNTYHKNSDYNNFTFFSVRLK